MENTNRKDGCAFCKNYNKVIRIHQERDKEEKQMFGRKAQQRKETCVYRSYVFFEATKEFYLNYESPNYNLNFCPECGRRLNMGKPIERRDEK